MTRTKSPMPTLDPRRCCIEWTKVHTQEPWLAELDPPPLARRSAPPVTTAGAATTIPASPTMRPSTRRAVMFANLSPSSSDVAPRAKGPCGALITGDYQRRTLSALERVLAAPSARLGRQPHDARCTISNCTGRMSGTLRGTNVRPIGPMHFGVCGTCCDPWVPLGFGARSPPRTDRNESDERHSDEKWSHLK